MSSTNTLASKEVVGSELDSIEGIIDDIIGGDEHVSYADTGDSMEVIDDLLIDDPAYQVLLSERRVLSSQIIRGRDEAEKTQGLNGLKAWISKVRQLF